MRVCACVSVCVCACLRASVRVRVFEWETSEAHEFFVRSPASEVYNERE